MFKALFIILFVCSFYFSLFSYCKEKYISENNQKINNISVHENTNLLNLKYSNRNEVILTLSESDSSINSVKGFSELLKLVNGYKNNKNRSLFGNNITKKLITVMPHLHLKYKENNKLLFLILKLKKLIIMLLN